MIPTANNSKSLLLIVSQNGLFQDLIAQLKKDFELSGMSITIDNAISSDDLTQDLYRQISQLIHTNFDAFLQLLYRVDVSEQNLQSNQIQETEELAIKATFTILKREWEKVYYRNKFS